MVGEQASGLEWRDASGEWGSVRMLPELGALSLDVLDTDQVPRFGKNGVQWSTRAGWVEEGGGDESAPAWLTRWIAPNEVGVLPDPCAESMEGSLRICPSNAIPVTVRFSPEEEPFQVA